MPPTRGPCSTSSSCDRCSRPVADRARRPDLRPSDPDEAGLQVDVAQMVDTAIRLSRAGGFERPRDARAARTAPPRVRPAARRRCRARRSRAFVDRRRARPSTARQSRRGSSRRRRRFGSCHPADGRRGPPRRPAARALAASLLRSDGPRTLAVPTRVVRPRLDDRSRSRSATRPSSSSAARRSRCASSST